MRKDIDDLRDSQTSSFRTERSVLEAVLTQKLDRSVSDKVASVARRVDELSESLQRAVDRSSAITLAVDKQAKFLTDLNARLAETVDAAVARTLAAERSRGERSQGSDVLERSPVLDGDGDTIDVVKKSAPARKSRAKGTSAAAKKTAAQKAVAQKESTDAGEDPQENDPQE